MSGLSLRERRRVETWHAILSAARSQLATEGAASLSLRAVAREVGVSVQALYHYVDSRDALITALCTDSLDSLGQAVAAATAAADSRDERVVAATLAYRRWAFEHRHAFLLLFGTPLPGYAAPEDGPTTEAISRVGTAFASVLFEGWTDEERAAADRLDTAPPDGRYDNDHRYMLSAGGATLFTLAWGTLHGLVMLELLELAPWIGDAGEDLCRIGVLSVVEQIDASHAAAREALSS